MARVRGY
jgi:hypothetical protein